MHYVIPGEPIILEHTYSFQWNQDDQMVKITPVIKLIKDCGLEITEMVYFKDGPDLNNNCRITFVLSGIWQAQELFELKCKGNPDLAQFINLIEEDH